MVRDIMTVAGTGIEGIDILITMVTTMTIEAAGATLEAGTDNTINPPEQEELAEAETKVSASLPFRRVPNFLRE